MRRRERESRGDGKRLGTGKEREDRKRDTAGKRGIERDKEERTQTYTEGGIKDTKRDTPTCVELHVSTANLTLQRNHLRVRLHQSRVFHDVRFVEGGFRIACHRYERGDLKRPSNQH